MMLVCPLVGAVVSVGKAQPCPKDGGQLAELSTGLALSTALGR